ncbi:hypothetical protein TrRE_jg11373 [Triparma retinervis]|uniref:Uncharacterized protein n=1 Tax=Triparma retinervis TaxID=2557542 RepID=A0A9W7ALD1_9STRA|nr:hypothetical protein TrRE_jg11373 [Triparma retinervis]
MRNLLFTDYTEATRSHLRAHGIDDESIKTISITSALTKIASYQRNYGGDEFGHKFPFPSLTPEEEVAFAKVGKEWGGGTTQDGQTAGVAPVEEQSHEGHDHGHVIPPP